MPTDPSDLICHNGNHNKREDGSCEVCDRRTNKPSLRVLDAEIARFMKWRNVRYCPNATKEFPHMAGGEWMGEVPPGPYGGVEDIIPYYSIDPRAAWDVVQKLTSTTKQWFRFEQHSTGCKATFEVIGAGDKDGEWSAEAEEMPEAVCRAALLALEARP